MPGEDATAFRAGCPALEGRWYRLSAPAGYARLFFKRMEDIKSKYMDEKCYEFHEGDSSGKCFLCGVDSGKLFIVRQVSSMKMVHMCGECMVEHSSEYLLDNTRPWEGGKDGDG